MPSTNHRDPTEPAGTQPHAQPWYMRALVGVIVAAVALLVLTPTALSSWSLYEYAGKPWTRGGLGLPPALRPLLPGAFDLLALLGVGLMVYAAWRYRERAGLLRGLVWLLAGSSALLQWHHSPYDPRLFAGLSLLGPAALEIVLHRWRRWLKRDAGETGFGLRWLLAPAETWRAWRLSVLERLSATDALDRLRHRQRLAGLPDLERIAYALGELAAGTQGNPGEAHRVRVWLSDHGITVPSQTLHAAIARTDRVPPPAADTAASHGGGHPPPPVTAGMAGAVSARPRPDQLALPSSDPSRPSAVPDVQSGHRSTSLTRARRSPARRTEKATSNGHRPDPGPDIGPDIGADGELHEAAWSLFGARLLAGERLTGAQVGPALGKSARHGQRILRTLRTRAEQPSGADEAAGRPDSSPASGTDTTGLDSAVRVRTDTTTGAADSTTDTTTDTTADTAADTMAGRADR